MAKKSEGRQSTEAEAVETPALNTYYFPDIAQGVTVYASSIEEANEKAEEIRKAHETVDASK